MSKNSLYNLLVMYKKGNTKVIEEIIEKYTIRTVSIAKSYLGLGIEKDDLIQLAFEGLIIGIQNNNNFNINNYTTLLDYSIEQNIKSALEDLYEIELTKYEIKILQANNYLKKQLKRKPTIEEINEITGINETKIITLFKKLNAKKRLDFTIKIKFYNSLYSKRLLDIINKTNLTELEKKIIELKYFENYSDFEIKSELNLTRKGLSYALRKILKTLKHSYQVLEYMKLTEKEIILADETRRKLIK